MLVIKNTHIKKNGVQFGKLRVSFPVFEENVVLLAPSDNDPSMDWSG